MQLEDKLAILADSAKYDVACTSSGVDRAGVHGKLGCSVAAGICHSFTPDGRCISLLKVLYSNACCYDCGYCVNRRSNDVPRATFTPRELAELTIGFYKRNYIEGLFLSSAVIGTPDYTMERMIEALRILRQEYHFNGYIHAKTIPGADAELVRRIGLLADRLSVNIELPSEASLSLLAPDKKKQAILKPMGQIAVQSAQSKKELVLYRHAPAFAPAGQSTQMIIGATPESDRHIMGLAESLYKKYSLKRVFFSAYLPVNSDSRLPALPLQLFEQLQAAPVGQHDVQQNTVVIVSGDLVERRRIIGGLLDHILFPAQGLHHDLPQGGFVFDNQNFHNRIFSGCKTNARIRKETETAHVPRKPNIRKFPVPRNAGHPGICRKETETITGFRLSVVYFFGGHPPAPENYFSEESIWQAFEPS